MQAHKPLANKVALITGAARRIGAEIARTLHQAGMNIILHYHTSAEAAETLCQQLNQQRAQSAITVSTDLQKPGCETVLMQKVTTAWQRLDVLVNNASCFYRTNLGNITEHDWDDLINTNLRTPFFLAQAAAPLLRTQQGCIVNITDIHAERLLKDYAVYCISKAGLVAATKILAKELGPDIRVNAVAPGAIIWPEGENTLSAQDKQNIIDRTMLARSGNPEDIAKAVLFFIRDAGYVTGQILAVDGGRILAG
jgi:pteridine reductase